MGSIKDKFLDRYFEPVEETEKNNENTTMVKETVQEETHFHDIEVESTVVENQVSVVLKPTIISKGTEIQGRFSAENDLEVRGKIVGDVDIEGSLLVEGGIIEGNIHAKSILLREARIVGDMTSQNFVEVYDESYIEGDIQGQNASIDGECKGNIKIEDALYLMPHAKSKGNIVAARLKVDDGAWIEGQIKTKR